MIADQVKKHNQLIYILLYYPSWLTTAQLRDVPDSKFTIFVSFHKC